MVHPDTTENTLSLFTVVKAKFIFTLFGDVFPVTLLLLISNCSSQPSPQDAWIGLYKTADDHNSLRWVDNTPFVFSDAEYYQPWLDEEPNFPTHRGIRIKAEYSEWADHPYSLQYWAICEKCRSTRWSVFP